MLEGELFERGGTASYTDPLEGGIPYRSRSPTMRFIRSFKPTMIRILAHLLNSQSLIKTRKSTHPSNQEQCFIYSQWMGKRPFLSHPTALPLMRLAALVPETRVCCLPPITVEHLGINTTGWLMDEWPDLLH